MEVKNGYKIKTRESVYPGFIAGGGPGYSYERAVQVAKEIADSNRNAKNAYGEPNVVVEPYSRGGFIIRDISKYVSNELA